MAYGNYLNLLNYHSEAMFVLTVLSFFNLMKALINTKSGTDFILNILIKKQPSEGKIHFLFLKRLFSHALWFDFWDSWCEHTLVRLFCISRGRPEDNIYLWCDVKYLRKEIIHLTRVLVAHGWRVQSAVRAYLHPMQTQFKLWYCYEAEQSPVFHTPLRKLLI